MPLNDKNLNLRESLTRRKDLNLGVSQTSTTHDGYGQGSLDGVSGISVGERHHKGNVATILDDIRGGIYTTLEGVTGSAVGSRWHYAEGAGNLDGVLGYTGIGEVIHNTPPTPQRCLPANNGIPLRGNWCFVQQEARQSIKTVCLTAEKAVLWRFYLCLGNLQATRVKSALCVKMETGLLKKARICTVSYNIPPLRVVSCISGLKGLHVSAGFCCPKGGGSQKTQKSCLSVRNRSNYADVENVVYPGDGSPFVPNGVYGLQVYGRYGVNEKIRPTNADRGVYRYPMAFGTQGQYVLESYTRDTFYVGVVGEFPIQDIDRLTLRRSPVEYIRGQTTPVNYYDYMGNAPLSRGLCSRNNQGVIVGRNQCLSVTSGVNVERDTCKPYDTHIELVPPPNPPVTPPSTGTTFLIPVKDSYTMINSFNAQLENGTEIALSSFRIVSGSDGFARQWSGVLIDPSQRSLVQPLNDGTPVILDVTVNGVAFKLLIESLKTERSYNAVTVSISGRGVSALLDFPYQRKTTTQITDVQTNQQIAESFLPQGWSLTWDIPVWNIPPNAYGHKNLTPAKALVNLVSDCGGMLVPDRVNKTLKAIKRYPVVPWQYANVNPDIVIPGDVILSLSEEPRAKYGANGVWIHGLDGGKQALVRLSGTPGDRLAETEYNPLMVDSVAIRALGERVLSDAQPAPRTGGITLPMDNADVPFIDVGMFTKISVDGGDDRGIVSHSELAVDVSDGAITTMQKIDLGGGSSNIYQRFSEVLPATPTLVGKATASSGGVTTLTFPDGESVKVRGSGTVGKYYFTTDNVLGAQAPDVIVISDIIV